MSNTLRELCPELDYSKSDSENNFKVIQEALGYDHKINLDEFNCIVDASQDRILKNIDLDRLRKADKIWGKPVLNAVKKMAEYSKNKIADKVFQPFFETQKEEINVNTVILNYIQSEDEKYFRNSKMNFTDTDKKTLSAVYIRTTANTWIDNKDMALEYRYIFLQKTKEELENDNKSDFLDNKLQKINKDLEKFKKANPNIDYNKLLDPNTGKLLEEYVDEVDVFKDMKLKSKLSKDFLEDEKRVDNFEAYKKLSKDDKKKYLRNTIVALNIENATSYKSENKLFAKFAKRRLEILNNDENNFIKIIIPEENSPISFKAEIDKNAILEEYNKLSSHKFENYDELSNYCELCKMQYINSKFEKFEKLKESDFIKLKPTSSNVEKVEEIENIKFKSKVKEKDKEDNSQTDKSEKVEDFDATDIIEEKKILRKSLRTILKDSVSNFVQTILPENELEEKRDNELLPVETKNGFLHKIATKIRSMFKNQEYGSDEKEKNNFQNTNYSVNDSLSEYKVDGKIDEAIEQMNNNKDINQIEGQDDVIR